MAEKLTGHKEQKPEKSKLKKSTRKKSVKENLSKKQTKSKGPKNPLLEKAISFEAHIVAKGLCKEQEKHAKEKWSDEKFEAEFERIRDEVVRPVLAGSAYNNKGLAQYLIERYLAYKQEESVRLSKKQNS